ncbi:hypothetical protein ILUMI_12767, partial [Ignelater luminosus]
RRSQKNVNKERDDLAALTFDYMQNLQLVLIPMQDLFYLTQLTVSVFCIHDLKTNTAYFYIFPENIAPKEPDEQIIGEATREISESVHAALLPIPAILKTAQRIRKRTNPAARALTTLSKLVKNSTYSKTSYGQGFLLLDSGTDDPNRILSSF